MNVTVEDVGPCKKHLKIVVPQSEVKVKVEESYTKLRSGAMVDGFRKGHVPRKLLERRFGEEVLEEVKQNILADVSQKAIEEKGLKPIGEPSFDNVEFDPEKDCVFEMTLEVEPQFELGEYKGLTLTRKSAAVTDEDIRQAIESLRMRRARLEPVGADGATQADDHIVCDWELNSDGEMVASEKNDEIIARGRGFGGAQMEKDASEVLAGAKTGEARTVGVKLLDIYPVEKWRGKDGTLTLTVKEIRRPLLPEVSEEFAKALDFESLKEMNEVVRRSLEQSKERDVALDLEQQAFDQLLDRTRIELPEGVLKAQARNIMLRQQFRLRQRGVPQEELDKHLEDLRNVSEEAAARNLRVYFILDRIAEREKIFVTETEVDGRIAALAASYRTTPQKFRAQLEQESSLSELRSGMREDKVTDFLLKNSAIGEAKA